MATSRFLLISFAFLTLSSTSFAETVELRPNDPVYVKMGEKIYLEQCASCHGVNLEGQMGWQLQRRCEQLLSEYYAPEETDLAVPADIVRICDNNANIRPQYLLYIPPASA